MGQGNFRPGAASAQLHRPRLARAGTGSTGGCPWLAGRRAGDDDFHDLIIAALNCGNITPSEARELQGVVAQAWQAQKEAQTAQPELRYRLDVAEQRALVIEEATRWAWCGQQIMSLVWPADHEHGLCTASRAARQPHQARIRKAPLHERASIALGGMFGPAEEGGKRGTIDGGVGQADPRARAAKFQAGPD